jgi:hypothetical protein
MWCYAVFDCLQTLHGSTRIEVPRALIIPIDMVATVLNHRTSLSDVDLNSIHQYMTSHTLGAERTSLSDSTRQLSDQLGNNCRQSFMESESHPSQFQRDVANSLQRLFPGIVRGKEGTDPETLYDLDILMPPHSLLAPRGLLAAANGR